MSAKQVHIGIDPATVGVRDATVVADRPSPTGRLAPNVMPDPWQLPPIGGPSLWDKIKAEHYREDDDGRRPDFVRAFLCAVKKLPSRIDTSTVVEDPRRFDQDVIQDWIFGPHGEFTGFAKINLMEELDKKALMFAVRGPPDDFTWSPRHHDLHRITFAVTPVHIPDHSRLSLYPYQMDAMMRLGGFEGRERPVLYVRFATYDDYALWAALASHDHYGSRR